MSEIRTRSHTTAAFTLLELSIVLVLIGFIVGGGLVTLTASIQTSQYNTTVNTMQAIDDALYKYRVAFNRLPCPAQLSLPWTDVNYGIEAGASTPGITSSTTPSSGVGNGVCSGTISVNIGGTPTAENVTPYADSVTPSVNSSTLSIAEGGVPTRALQLPDSYMYDGWSRKIRYAVEVPMTATSAFINQPTNNYCTSIEVLDASLSTARTYTATYLLLSHGANGHGGFTRSGIPFSSGSTNSNEITNCHCDSTTATLNTPYSALYVQTLPVISPTSPHQNFDDILTYKERWQLIPPGGTISLATSEIVAYDAFGIEAFCASNGVWLGTLNANTINHWPSADKNGTVYFSKISTQVGKYYANPYATPSGWYGGNALPFATLSCPSGTCGGFSNPRGSATDSQGNVWVADSHHGRLLKFDSSGNWILSIGGGGVCIATSCTMNTSGAVTPGASGAGTYQSPSFSPTNAIKCAKNATGCTGGSAFYYFTNSLPMPLVGVAVDSSDNVWISDYGNNRVYQFSSSGNLLMMIGGGGICFPGTSCTLASSGNTPVTSPSSTDTGDGTIHCNNASACTSGYDSYSFGQAMGIAADNKGNIFVADDAWNRVVEYNATTGTFEAQFPCASGACSGDSSGTAGMLYTPYGVAVDSLENVWVGDFGNNRIEEFSQVGGTWTYQKQIPCASGNCGSTQQVSAASVQGIAIVSR